MTLNQRQENSPGSRRWIRGPISRGDSFSITGWEKPVEFPWQISQKWRIDRRNRLRRDELSVIFRHLETAIPLPGIAATRLTTIPGNIATFLEGDGANTLRSDAQVEPANEGQCQKEACCQLSSHDLNRNPPPAWLSIPPCFRGGLHQNYLVPARLISSSP